MTPFGPVAGWTWGNNTLAVRTYDADGRIIQIDSAGFSSYSYNADGTINSRLDDTPSSYSLPAGVTNITVAGSSNRVTATSGALTRTYTYDAVGNVTTLGPVTFSYNYANRMSSSTQSSITTTYTYDALGQRVRKATGGSTRLFLYDEAGHLVGEYDGSGNLIEETVWLGDIPVRRLLRERLKPANPRPGTTYFSIVYTSSATCSRPTSVLTVQ